jgi:hypothetical protein
MNVSDNTHSDSEKNSSIPSVEDFLNLWDWSFKATFEVGQHNDYHWAILAYSVDFEKFIPFPQQPYRVLITHCDGYGVAADCYSNNPGWRTIGKCALSDFVTGQPPAISNAADTTFMLLDKPSSDQELLAALQFINGEPDPANSSFWLVIERLQPYLFISNTDKEFFASKNKHVLDILHSESALADTEERERMYLKASRLTKWKSIGPECGPEKCVEAGCGRLRIERAVRCYVHQLQAFGGVF